MSLNHLRERRDLVADVAALSDRQREALSARDYDALIEVLGQKQAALERLAGQTPAARDWLRDRASRPTAERSEGDTLLAETNELLAEAAAAEQAAVAELTDQRDAAQRELHEIAAAGRVHAAYRDALAPVTHRSLDVDR